MPGGGGKGGSQPSGFTTASTTNHPWNETRLNTLDQRAEDLSNNNPLQYYPGTTLANFDPRTYQGYNWLSDNATTGAGRTIADNAMDTVDGFMTGARGSYQGSPAYNGLNRLAYQYDPDLLRSVDSAQNVGNSLAGITAGTSADQQAARGSAAALSGNAAQGSQIGAGNTAQQQALGGISNQLQGLSGNALGAYNTGLAGLGAATGGLYGTASYDPTGRAQAGLYGEAGYDPTAQSRAGMSQLAGYDPTVAAGAAGLANSIGAAGFNPGTNSLMAAANGAFLNSNPYLDNMFGSASNAVTRAYKTATAPQTDSMFEGAGRGGSGAHFNATSQNEQNLGNSLGNLASNIYGNNYATERGLMTQAGGTVGSLYNQGVGLQQAGSSALGNLGLGEQGQRAGILNQSGQLGLGAQGQRLSAYGQAGNLGLGEQGQAANIYNSAGQLALGGANAGANAVNAATGALTGATGANTANLNSMLGGINAATGANQAAGNLSLGNVGSQISGANAQTNAYGQGIQGMLGQLGIQNSALGALQGGYNSANALQLAGSGQAGAVSDLQRQRATDILTAGQGVTGMGQQSINDLMARFYGNQNMPWQNLQNLSGIYGNPISGSSSTSTPYFTNQAANALGLATGGLGLYNGLKNAGIFGGGGSLGGYTAGLGSYASPFSGNVYDSGLASMIGLTSAAPAAASGGAGLLGLGFLGL